MPKKTLVSWSSGKDCAWALHCLNQDPDYEVVGLFSVLNQKHNYVPMHTTREALVKLQAKAAGLPLQFVMFPEPCSQEDSEAALGAFVEKCMKDGIECIAFGDLFLEDVRKHREDKMEGTGIEAIFPLWKIPTDELALQMLDGGIEAWISSVDLSKLPIELAGQRWTRDVVAGFPVGVDHCAENGEFHSIVVNGPMFSERIPVKTGTIVEREGYAYADILPA